MSEPSDEGASRDGYGKALLRLADDPRVVVLEADLGKSTKSCHFREQFPERTVSMGIAEQNMMLVAAGMASSGKIPFAGTFAIFTERAFEQVRNGIARPGLQVHICGSHGGIHTGSDGSSAQTVEDLAIYRSIPKMTVIHPCDDLSAEELTFQLLDLEGPSYMRTARNKVSRMYDEESKLDLRIGTGSVLKEGNDVAIISCGVMVELAREAASSLSEEGIECTVVDMHTIKPLDKDLLARLSEQCGCFVSAEDHSVIGGLGGAVAEWLSSNNPIPLEMVGVKDRFGESGGTSELMVEIGLTSEAICEAVRKCVDRKNAA
ncbi:MAG TPA: transketolase family protein [Candidatus Poseidoniales archaeon]|jgi:transketolase|nr:MAG: transketolase [Euryarchaeota archaeon]HIG34312.1 transketolase family protein [Candidatus Poseidoniales archaeon]HIL67756.1 transketolase family protein [Candidatus Poseidoniales archaeon]